MRKLFVGALVLLAVSSLLGNVAYGQANIIIPGETYTITKIESGTKATTALGISDNGIVSGKGGLTAFRFMNGVYTDLGTFGGQQSQSSGVNNAGTAVGWADPPDFATPRAFRYSGSGPLVNLGSFGPNGFSFAYGINNAGQIVGYAQDPVPNRARAFLYENGVMNNLGTLGGQNSFAFGLNDLGHVVGSSAVTGIADYHATLYKDGVLNDLGTMGGTTSEALAINNADQIVGYAVIGGNRNAFLYDDGTLLNLGTLGGATSTAKAINDDGVIVGQSKLVDGSDRAFIFLNGAMFDLNTLIADNTDGWLLTDATGINEAGQIVGTGTINGSTRAFVMAPTPEPGLSLTAVGLAGLALRRKRKQ